jgi:hypothetical protein
MDDPSYGKLLIPNCPVATDLRFFDKPKFEPVFSAFFFAATSANRTA